MRTELRKHGTGPEEFKAIRDKYQLEEEENNGTVWISLCIPEANLEITWFLEK